MSTLTDSLDVGEDTGGSVELKERLRPQIHLAEGKQESLAAQMRHRLLSGDGEATYVVGVTDDEAVVGIDADAFVETLDVLEELAVDVGAEIVDVESWKTDEGIVGTVTVVDPDERRTSVDENHIVVGTAGHVDHGKSTLVGALITGETDDGEGGLRSYLDVQPHEAERGLSADLSFALYGFDNDGTPMRLDNPDRDEDRARVASEADRVVSFVDNVGHQPWLRTTIRGLLGQEVDYGLLTVAADDGPTQTTREHLGILLATDIPTIVVVTKTDLVDDERVTEVRRSVGRLLRDAGKTDLDVESLGVDEAIDEVSDQVVPVFTASPVADEGMEELDEFFARAPARASTGRDEPFRLYVDRVYSIPGVGPVVSGSVASGTVAVGQDVQIGPFDDGSYRTVTVRSIEQHYHAIDEATPGQLVGIALSDVEQDEVSRGMALGPPDVDLPAVREFRADLSVLNHPTSISSGYEPVVHLETVSEAATIEPDDGRLLPGKTGPATLTFTRRPYLVEPGQTFVYREGQSKGVGVVTDTTEVDR